uniref:Uncharacterized protein n=1 Tax=Pararge aegeria TaxID=116150 RepID=S4NVI0_9NEOP
MINKEFTRTNKNGIAKRPFLYDAGECVCVSLFFPETAQPELLLEGYLGIAGRNADRILNKTPGTQDWDPALMCGRLYSACDL